MNSMVTVACIIGLAVICALGPLRAEEKSFAVVVMVSEREIVFDKGLNYNMMGILQRSFADDFKALHINIRPVNKQFLQGRKVVAQFFQGHLVGKCRQYDLLLGIV